MSGDGKRSVAKWPKLPAPILDSTNCDMPVTLANVPNCDIGWIEIPQCSDLLTDPRQFDMLYPSPGPWGIECNSIN